MALTAPAVVAYSPSPKLNFRYEEVRIPRPVKENELLIKMVATGICHTDIYVGSLPHGTMGLSYPCILGHEGAGYVEEVGAGVTAAKVGDPVILSYGYCGSCELCSTGRPSYCVDFIPINILGRDGDVFESTDGATQITGKFFGQSSFSSLSIANETSIVNVKGLVKDSEELKLLSPFGCGLQTGAGAVINSGEARPNDVIVVTGLGGVGLGAIMAANVVGCKSIIAVDKIQSRLDLAQSLGATHVLNTSGLAEGDFQSAITTLVDNTRISLAIETTGVPWISMAAMTCLGKRGKFIQIGVPIDQNFNITFPMADLFGNQKILEGNIMGSSRSREFIPKMIGWYRDGKFPVEKLVKFYDAKDVANALHGMEDGSVIKPVLVW
jgi:Zn-dependent alcohol dehydrogenase